MEFNRFLTKPGFMPVMTCDLDDCQNKGGGINEKQAYYQSLGPTVNVNEKVFHVKCLELHSRKEMLDQLAEKGKIDAE
jgi:hypothetical protein